MSRPRRAPIAAGIGRSLRIYYGDVARAGRMRALYRHFVPQGGLAFDIGAHVGDRTACFRALGARTVTVEPQAAAMRALRLIHGRDPGVTLIPAALGPEAGHAQLQINSANPTVSSLSEDFIAAAEGAQGWEGQVWDRAQMVDVTTLDRLISTHGLPDFIKIDVEGLEDAVLAGLSHAVPALSFEFTTIQRDVGLAALRRVAALGSYHFTLSLGERFDPDLTSWTPADQMADQIAALPAAANSGDVYARLVPGQATG